MLIGMFGIKLNEIYWQKQQCFLFQPKHVDKKVSELTEVFNWQVIRVVSYEWFSSHACMGQLRERCAYITLHNPVDNEIHETCNSVAIDFITKNKNKSMEIATGS